RREAGAHLRGDLGGDPEAAAGIRRIVPPALVPGDRQRGHALARGGGRDARRIARLRHARQPRGGEARLREADLARAWTSARRARPLKPWKRAAHLRLALDALLAETDAAARVRGDPV